MQRNVPQIVQDQADPVLERLAVLTSGRSGRAQFVTALRHDSGHRWHRRRGFRATTVLAIVDGRARRRVVRIADETRHRLRFERAIQNAKRHFAHASEPRQRRR